MPAPLVITLPAADDQLRFQIEQQISPYGRCWCGACLSC